MRTEEDSEEPDVMVLGEAWRTQFSLPCAVQPLSKLELYLFFSADLCGLILLKIEMR